MSALARVHARAAATLERADMLCAQGRPAVARALLERSIRRRARGGGAASSALLSAVARTHLMEGDIDAALSCL
ncbi:MAG: tetratricopeptide repeat protein, partial [Gemmatirosa sp.]